MTGDFAQASGLHEQALARYREVGSPHGETQALEGIARSLAGTGDRSSALTALREAVSIFQHICAAEARVAAEYLTSPEAEDTSEDAGVEGSTD